MTLLDGRFISSLLLLLYAVGVADAQAPGAAKKAPQKSPQGTETFAVVACNKSKAPNIFFAIASRVVEPNDLTRVQGWWQVPQGQCTQIGTFPAPGFLFYARAPAGATWSGKTSFRLCVNLDAGFNAVVSSSKETQQCDAGHLLVPFTAVAVGAGQKSYTVNLD